MVVEIGWSKPTKASWMLVSSGEPSLPFLYFAEGKAMVYNVATGEVTLGDGIGPRFHFHPTARGYGVELLPSKAGNAEFDVDLPGLLRGTAESRQLESSRDGGWRLSAIRQEARSKSVASYDDAPGYPLRRLESRLLKEEVVELAVTDLQVNDNDERRWPAFPAVENFGQEVRPVRLKESQGEEFLLELRRATLALLLRQFPDPRVRSATLLGEVDWKQADKNAEEDGPFLRKLFQVKPID
ncbi:hypothetical protein [Lignipirellula cremea]|nr:hypothetical protein [Lignipirellula cremea]